MATATRNNNVFGRICNILYTILSMLYLLSLFPGSPYCFMTHESLDFVASTMLLIIGLNLLFRLCLASSLLATSSVKAS